MAGLPQFLISTQTDPYWEIPFFDTVGNPLSVEGRTFEVWIAPATTKTGVGEPVEPLKVLTFQDGLSLVPPTDGSGDQTVKNTFVHQVSRAFAQASFPRGELTADILEVVGGARRLLVPVRLRYDDPAAIRDFVADRAGVTFGQGRQPIVTPVAVAGQAGRRGAGFITGSGSPTPSDGEDGDYWIDGAADPRVMYGPKADGAWPAQGEPFTADLTPALVEARDEAVAAAAQTAQHAGTTQADRQAVESSTAQVEASRQVVVTATAMATTQATIAQNAVSTGRLVYDTLTLLSANLVPTDGAQGEVVADGANNGTYRKSGPSGTGSWAKKSSATVPAVDARAAALEKQTDDGFLNSDYLYGWADGLDRLLGGFRTNGSFSALLDMVRLKQGSTIEWYDTLDPDPFAFVDPNGKVVFRPSSQASSPDVQDLALARGSRSLLSDRLNASLNAYGMPRQAAWGQWYLRETRERLMARKQGLSRQAKFLVIGDSFSQEAPRWSGPIANLLMAEYGDAGGGWVGFTTSPGGFIGNARPTVYTVGRSAGWANTTFTSPSPDSCSVSSTTAGSVISLAGPALPILSGADLFFLGTADGQVRYRWNGGAWTTLDVTGSGLAIAALPANMPTSGAWTLGIEVVSGTVTLCGVNLKSAASGVVVHKTACSSIQAAQYAALDQTQWVSGIAGLGFDAALIMLGTNDQAASRSVAQFTADLTTIIARVRLARSKADIAILMPAENQRGLTIKMADYAAAAYALAVQQRCAFLDLQYAFGDSPADYAYGSDRPWIGSDTLHPDPAYQAMAAAIHPFLTR